MIKQHIARTCTQVQGPPVRAKAAGLPTAGSAIRWRESASVPLPIDKPKGPITFDFSGDN